MPTATLEQDLLVSQPLRETLYASRRSELRLVKTAQYPRFGPQGQVTGLFTEGVTIPFVEGNLRVPFEGEMTTERGVKVDAAEVNEWLQRHPMYRDLHDGFWKVEVATPPVSAEEMTNLMRLGQEFDREGLEKLIAQERQGWNREQLIVAAQASIATVDRAEAEARAQAETKPKGK